MSNKTLKYFLVGLPVAVAGYLVFRHLRKSKAAAPASSPTPIASTATVSNSSGGLTPKIASAFPLKKGSKGAKVKELQEAILTVNKALLPKYGADSDFGSETEAAVNTLLKKKTIDSQDDIAKILSISKDMAAMTKTAQVDADRASLANKLKKAFEASPGKFDFYALHKTDITRGKITSDGREFGNAVSTLSPGGKIGLKGKADVKLIVNSKGFIQANYTENGQKVFAYFSPYAFEVK